MDVTYQYKAIDGSGKTIESNITAGSKEAAVSLIKAKGQQPIQISEAKQSSQDVKDVRLFRPKVKLPHLTTFCKQLATMLRAGLQLDKALGVLIAQTEDKMLRAAVIDVSLNVKQGTPLSKAMQKQPDAFPQLLINMIEAGEMTGDMDGSLERMAVHYDKENRTSHKIKGAMIYPAVLLVLTVVMVIAMLVFVLPMFSSVFEGQGRTLPAPTLILIGLSHALRGYWYVFIIVIVGIVITITNVLRTHDGKLRYDNMLLKNIIVKKPITQIITARFTRTLSSLLGSGIPIIRALDMAADTTNNLVVNIGIKDVIEEMKQGSTLGVQLQKMRLFPQMMISMITIGEETGAMEELLLKTADYYDGELDAAISKLLSIIEPVLIIFMAVCIGAVLIAMYLPMFDMFTGGM